MAKKGKKKEADIGAAPEGPKRIQKMKGGFGVFVRRDLDHDPVTGDEIPSTPYLEQICSSLKDTLDAERWIRVHAEEYQNQTLVIAQIKKSVTVKVETQVKVSFE